MDDIQVGDYVKDRMGKIYGPVMRDNHKIFIWKARCLNNTRIVNRTKDGRFSSHEDFCVDWIEKI
jgi:hypothetical protein